MTRDTNLQLTITGSILFRLRRGLASALLALPLLAGFAATGAQAQVECTTANTDGSYTVPFNWALKPSDVSGGEKFRLLFLTSTKNDATLSGITHYNERVRDRAKAGHRAITDSCGNKFTVIGSTATVDARVNTGTRSTDTDAAIYWLNGAKAADNYGDFYDGSWASGKARNETGAAGPYFTYVFTGSNSDGTKDEEAYLGNTKKFRTRLGLIPRDPMSAVEGGRYVYVKPGITDRYPFYALSPVFMVGTPPTPPTPPTTIARITVTADRHEIYEGQNAVFTFHANPAPAADLVVPYLIGDGFGAAGDKSKTVERVTIPAGALSAKGEKIEARAMKVRDVRCGIEQSGDFIGQPKVCTTNQEVALQIDKSGYISVTINASSATKPLYLVGNPSSASSKVRDAHYRLPHVGFAEASSTAAEGDGTVKVKVNVERGTFDSNDPENDPGRLKSSAFAITVRYTVTGTATQGDDFTIANSGTLKIARDWRINQVVIPVTIVGDAVEDNNETVVLTLESGDNHHLDPIQTHTLTITNDETGTSGDGSSTSQAACTAASPSVALLAEVKAHIADFTARNHRNGIRDWTLVLDRLEGREGMSDEKIAAWLANSRRHGWADGTQTLPKVQATLAAARTAAEQCLAAETSTQQQVPEISIIGGAGVTEGGNAVFTLTASPAPAAALTVDVTVTEAGGYATAGTHQVTIPTSGTATLRLATTNDATDEPDGSVTATLTASDGYTVSSSQGTASVAVADDDAASPAVFVPNAQYVAAVTAKADNHSNAAAAARLRKIVKGMTGEDGGYTAAECREVAARHGVTGAWQPWCDEIARRENWAETTPIPTPTPTPTVSIAGGADVTEGGNAVFTLTATPAPAAALTVDVTVTEAGGYATAGTHQVTIPTSGTATLTVATTGDDVDELDGSVTATLRPGNGYTVAASQGTASVGVTDDDLPPAFVPDAALVAAVTAKANAHPNPAAAARLRRIVQGMTGTPGGYTAAQCREVAATHGVTRTWQPWCDEIARRAAVVAVGAPGAVYDRLTLTLHDAEGQEGSPLTFRVTLSAPAPGPVSVVWLTRPGTATPHVDYTFSVGRLHFAPGATAQTLTVPTLQDAHDDSGETFTVALYAPRGAIIARDVATGTIRNDDPMPNAWLARFGRTVATHVTDAVSDRLRTPTDAPVDSQITLGGVRLPVRTRSASAESTEDGLDPALVQGVAGWLGLSLPSAPATADPARRPNQPVDGDPRVTARQPLGGAFDLRQFLLGSSFRLALGREAATRPHLTAWGRFAGTTFAGTDAGADTKTNVDGDVFTGTVGLDATGTRWVAGVAVAHSQGTGAYTQTLPDSTDQGDLEQTLTSLHPYLRYALTDRLDVWGLAGYGWGDLDLEVPNQETLETQTTLLMGAVGARGRLLDPADTGGYALATRTEALFSQTSSDAVGTSLNAGEAAAHRLRLILEGSRGFSWTDGRQFTPTVELGLRHDWGDAETGFGLELGGRVRYADPAWGLTVEGAVRGLVAHEDTAYEEWGASGTVRVAPGPNGQGLALTLSPTWGAAASGVDTLWSSQTTAGLAPTGRSQATQSGQLAAEVGYGVPAGMYGQMGMVTPYAGTVLTAGTNRTYRLGLRLTLRPTGTQPLALSLEGMRQEAPGLTLPNQGLRLQATWGF